MRILIAEDNIRIHEKFESLQEKFIKFTLLFFSNWRLLLIRT